MPHLSVERRLELVRLACRASVAHFSGQEAPDIDGVGLELDDLQFLLIENFDSAIYLPYDPSAPAQRLYDALWREQRLAEAELASALSGAEFDWAVVQGMEAGANAFRGEAFSRRGDIDLLVTAQSMTAVEDVLRSLGMAQLALNEVTKEPVEVTPEYAAAVERDQYFGKRFSYSFVRPLDVADDVLEVMPDMLTPMFRDNGGVKAFVSVEPVMDYSERMTAERVLHDARVPERRYLVAEANFVISAKRLIDGLAAGDNKLRLVCELCVRRAQGPDWTRVEQFAQRWGEAEALDAALGLVGYAMSAAAADRPPRRTRRLS